MSKMCQCLSARLICSNGCYAGQDVSLEDVLAQGVKFKPEILEWIARLLNPIAYLADHSLNQETGMNSSFGVGVWNIVKHHWYLLLVVL